MKNIGLDVLGFPLGGSENGHFPFKSSNAKIQIPHAAVVQRVPQWKYTDFVENRKWNINKKLRPHSGCVCFIQISRKPDRSARWNWTLCRIIRLIRGYLAPKYFGVEHPLGALSWKFCDLFSKWHIFNAPNKSSKLALFVNWCADFFLRFTPPLNQNSASYDSRISEYTYNYTIIWANMTRCWTDQ